jgi:hypothetical protein
MPKFRAPDGCPGINVGGAFFAVDADGCITVPGDGDYGRLVIPHGFVFEPTETATETTETTIEKETP